MKLKGGMLNLNSNRKLTMKHLKLDQIATILVTAITKYNAPVTTEQTLKIDLNVVREQANRKLGKIATKSLVNRISRLLPDYTIYVNVQLDALVVSATSADIDVVPYFIDFKLESEEDCETTVEYNDPTEETE